MMRFESTTLRRPGSTALAAIVLATITSTAGAQVDVRFVRTGFAHRGRRPT
jgi:hypothetical protein